MTLSKALVPQQTLLTQVILAIGGTLIIALSARIEVPMIPVPMSLQTLAISVIGLVYGSRLAGATLLAYLAEGAMGLPVFAGGGTGIAYMMGPTGGFLLGFVGMAWMTGWMVERGFDGGLPRLFLAAFIPATLLFVPGVLWLWAITPLDLTGALKAGALPFLVGDVVKSAMAALIVLGGWQALRSRKG